MSSTINTRSIYSDFNINFDLHPISSDVSRQLNENAVVRSIKNLIFTDFYERPFKPSIGCNIRKLLFENFTPTTQSLIQTTIAETLQAYEPRASIISIDVTPYEDLNGVSITIIFSVINREEPIVIDFFLDRIR